MTPSTSFHDLADHDLLIEVKRLAHGERHATVALIASLAEIDARRLYLGKGYSSLFTYCTHVLRLSEHAAYGRIEAARAARRFPLVLELLGAGDITLSTVCLLRPHLTEENHRDRLQAARHKSKREVEQFVATLHPRPDVQALIRKLPQTGERATPSMLPPDGPNTGANVNQDRAAARPTPLADVSARMPSPPPRPAVVAPLALERYKIQVTVSRETHDRLRRAQDLLRHAVPNGDPAEILDRALTLLVAHLEKTKLASVRKPRSPQRDTNGSRRIPAAIRRAVWERDEGQCAFLGGAGRCVERSWLEFHHVVPYARGGSAVTDNIQLRCRAHNQYEAREDFGSRDRVREQQPRYAVADRRQPGLDRVRPAQTSVPLRAQSRRR